MNSIFQSNIIEWQEKNNRLRKIQYKFENDLITENDISVEDKNELIALYKSEIANYESQIDEYNRQLLNYKDQILKIRKNLG